MWHFSKTKRNFIGLHTLFALLSSAIGAVLLHATLPGHYFGGFPLIPLYFYLFGVFSIYLFDACRRRAPGKMLLLYMALKVVKMIGAITFIVIYCLLVRQEAKVFLLAFVVFYFVYLVFETWFFFTFELNKKQQLRN